MATAIPFSAGADAKTEARYPYDPACPWGRIANGQGMLHRCLKEDEARSLLGRNPSELKSRKVPRDSEDQPKEALPEEEETQDDQKSEQKEVEISIGPIQADKGNITIGALDRPMDRYKECVDQHGGLDDPTGQVVVRFLVRVERRRAEGTEVDSYQGVSPELARCIADIVDRRRVGTPEVPLTGARLTFKLSQRPQKMPTNEQ